MFPFPYALAVSFYHNNVHEKTNKVPEIIFKIKVTIANFELLVQQI